MIKTSEQQYVTLKRLDYYKQPAIPIRSENGRLLVLAFMSRDYPREVWIERNEIAEAT